MHREYKECSCSITAWSHGRRNSTAVLFPGEITLWRIWGRHFGFVSNVPGKELFWKSIARCCMLVQEMSTELVVTPGALSKWFAWWDAAQSSHDATWCWHLLCFLLSHRYNMQLVVDLCQCWRRSIHPHTYRSRWPSAWDSQHSQSKAIKQRNWWREHLPSISQTLSAGQYKASSAKDQNSWR